MHGYEALAQAVLRQTFKDLCRGARGSHRGRYVSARRFLNMPLFVILCRLIGCRPDIVRREMIRRSSRHRERLQHPPQPPGR